MKFILKRYQTISIWLSLLIISLAFVIDSDRSARNVFVPIAFFAGMLLYMLGGIREWTQSRLTAALIEASLAVCMLIGGILSLFRLGGLL